jgi:hypothetical protein
MLWAQFDDHFHDSEAVLIAGPEACGLHLWATCWSAAHLTDGELPGPIAERLIDSYKDGDEMVAQLVAAKLWEKHGTGGARCRARQEHAHPNRINSLGRVAQWESARFTRERSQVRNPPRPCLTLLRRGNGSTLERSRSET